MSLAIIDAHPAMQRRLREAWWVEWASVEAPPALSGRQQVVFNPTPRWRARLQTVTADWDGPKVWRAFVSQLRGRQRGLRLSPEVGRQASLWSRLGIPLPPMGVGIPHGEGVLFGEGVGYGWEAPPFVLAEAAAAFDDEIVVDLLGFNGGFRDGDWLGVGGRLHAVTRVLDPEGEGSGMMRLGIEPPLTVSRAAGTTVSIEPKIVMQLTADDQGVAERVGGTPLSQPSLELVEIPGAV